MPLGAIVKSVGSSIVKDKAKKVATDKLMGRGGKKGGASKETAQNMVSGGVSGSKKGQKPVAKTDGRRGRPKKLQTLAQVQADIDAKETDKRIVKISKDVTAIAEAMKGGLVLKEKAKRKERIAAERDKRAAQEADVEKPDEPKKKDSGGGIKVPGVGLLSGVFGFITKFIYGVVILKLIDFLPQLKKVLGLFKLAQPLFNGITNFVGGAFDLLTTFVDFGYKIADGAEKLVGKIFGEEGAEKFRTFMENVKNLINAFIIWKVVGEKIFKAVIKNIKNAFKLVKNFIKKGLNLASKLFPNVAKGATKLLAKGKGLVGKGVAKVGGLAGKIFGKAAGVISPAFKGAKPFLSKFFSKVPIVGPLVITIVSLLSGEPATQAIFKGLGAALGGALGTFIPIPILGTLIGETIGVFVGDLLYAGLFGGGMSEVGQKLKDTFKTFIEPVFNFFKDGIGRFFSNFPMIDIPAKFGIQTALGKLFPFMANSKGLVTSFPNLSLFIPGPGSIELIKHMGASFMPGIFGDKSESKKEEAKIDDKQDNKNGANADAVAAETTYESGEGNAVIIPVPVQQTQQVAIKNKRGRTVGYRTVVIDDTELAMYGGK